MGIQIDLGAITDSRENPLSLTMQAYCIFYKKLPADPYNFEDNSSCLPALLLDITSKTAVITQPAALRGDILQLPRISPNSVDDHPS